MQGTHQGMVCKIPATPAAWYHTPLPWARCQPGQGGYEVNDTCSCLGFPFLALLPVPGGFLKTPSGYSSGSTGLREDRFETGA